MESRNRSKIAIAVSTLTLRKVDRLVKTRVCVNRSRAMNAAVEHRPQRMSFGRLARECAKIDSATDHSMAEQGLPDDLAGRPSY